MTRQKILILGGGPSGLSAAYHLTNQPGWEDRYEITIHQLGWRLGGKGATGRSAKYGWRVQEHGIHAFAGFYDTTFRMMRDCYRSAFGEDGSRSGGQPGKMGDAFVGGSTGKYTEFLEGRWVTAPQTLPSRDGLPWVDPPRLRPREALVGMVDMMIHRHRPGTGHDADDLTSHKHSLWEMAEHLASKALHKELDKLAARLRKEIGQAHLEEKLLDDVLDVVASASKLVTKALEHLDLDKDSKLRIPLITLDMTGALLVGLLTKDGDGSRLIDREYDEIDHLTHVEWLRQNGASEATLRSAMVNMVPNILFGYPSGNSTQLPNVSAASFVGWMMRGFCLRGDSYYFFPAGTGEGVISPIYEVLKARGVRFEFFSKLEELQLSDDGTRVEKLHMQRQAEVVAGAQAYDPLVYVPELDFKVWPEEPNWDQLVDGARIRDLLAEQGTDLESWWAAPPTASTFDLEVGTDFDQVVWAIPPATIPYVGRQLLDRHENWDRLHKGVTTGATLALQIWLKPPAAKLSGKGVDVEAGRYMSPSYPMPLNAVAEFSEVLPYEAWGEDGPKSLIYACGPLADLEDPAEHDFSDTTVPRLAKERVLATSVQWLRSMGYLLPGAAEQLSNQVEPFSLDFSLLHAPDAGPIPEHRVAAQWMKANIDPPERYSLAPAGNSAARFDSWETGVDNLVAAGDWIRTGLNLGCFEGAVVGGALASHALTGHPTLADLPNYGFGHPGAEAKVVAPRLGASAAS